MKAQPSWSTPKNTAASICFLSLRNQATNIGNADTQLADSSVLFLLDAECCRLSLTVTFRDQERRFRTDYLIRILHIVYEQISASQGP